MKIPSEKSEQKNPHSFEPNSPVSEPEGSPLFQFKNNRPEATQLKRLQQLADDFTNGQHPIQQKINKTGLPDSLKNGIENLSGHSMDDVKVHYNSSKPSQLQAHAYAQGTDIHLASGQEKHLPHEAWHVVQQKQGRVKPTLQLKGKVNVNDDIGLEKEADVMGAKALYLVAKNKSILQRKVLETDNHSSWGAMDPLKSKNSASSNDIIQGDFYIKSAVGLSPLQVGAPGPDMRPWINPATGNPGSNLGDSVVFHFDKTGLDRQRQKGKRDWYGNTSGLTLGDKEEFDRTGPGHKGFTHLFGLFAGKWPGSRKWSAPMKGPHNLVGGLHTGSSLNQRANTGVHGVPQSPGNTAWGHQVAKQWGGTAKMQNVASVTNDSGAGTHAQEEYQTIAEDAITKVVHDNAGIKLSHFRLKHTVYKYHGTNVAKYVRFKVYHQVAGAGPWVLVVDQVTPDFAQYLAGGRAQAGTARQIFQMQLEGQLQGAVQVHAQKHGTANATVRSWDAAPPTPARSEGCFLTTACTEAKGLPDDCKELTLLRVFRDNYMISLPRGKSMIKEYYRIAPIIVQSIQRQPFSKMIWDRLYDELVLGSIRFIKVGDLESALDNYESHVLKLKTKYITNNLLEVA